MKINVLKYNSKFAKERGLSFAEMLLYGAFFGVRPLFK